MNVRCCLFLLMMCYCHADGETYVEESSFILRDIWPSSYDRYILYNGSLTTPNCNEIVTWIILVSTETISHDDVGVFIN